MAALTGLSSGGVAIANAHHAPLDRQASWLPVIWGSDQSRDLRRINTTGKSVEIEKFVSTEQQLLRLNRCSF
jgi:hypothetical protein